MKVNNVQYNIALNKTNPRYNNKTNVPHYTDSTSFKGGAGALVKFWDAVARGGFAASFTVQDMFGTNFPRTAQALNRNKKITGKNNYKAAVEVAVREFLTGPSMCLMPLFVLTAAKKIGGKSCEVPLEHISPFANEMKNVLINSEISHTQAGNLSQSVADSVKSAKIEFYKRMFSLALNDETQNGGEISEAAKKLGTLLGEYDDAPKRGTLKQLMNKDIVKKVPDADGVVKLTKVDSKDQILSKITEMFTAEKKLRNADYSSLLMSDMSNIIPKSRSITSLSKDFSNFGSDVETFLIKKIGNMDTAKAVNLPIESLMKDFKNLRVGSKFITNIAMFAATGLFMSIIPKLYTIYNTNPETDAFRSQDEQEAANANK